MNKGITHIFPFFSKDAYIKIEHCDLSEEIIEMRGIILEKKLLDKEIPLYMNNKSIKENVYYWQPKEFTMMGSLEDAINLTNKGLGF